MSLKPEGAGAVMASRHHGELAADDPQTALYRKLEYFPTPPWAARAGGELIHRLDPPPGVCWEPAAGEGHMAYGLRPFFRDVLASDVHLYPEAQRFVQHIDFLDATAAPAVGGVDWIVTNPPFGTAAEFVRLGLQRARRGVAILARASFLESAKRYPLFFGDTPLTVYAPFMERVPMTLGRWDPKASTATAYAWFVWVKAEFGKAEPRLIPIPPGSRERLARGDDAARFATTTSSPLFPDLNADPEAA